MYIIFKYTLNNTHINIILQYQFNLFMFYIFILQSRRIFSETFNKDQINYYLI